MEALVIVDVQAGYVSGRDAITDADAVVEALRALVAVHDGPVHQTVDVPAPPVAYSAEIVEWTPPETLPPHALPLLDVPTLYKTALPHRDGYSSFHAVTRDGVPLREVLEREGVERVVVGGLSLEYCVKATALDALDAGFDVVVPLDLTRPDWPSLGLGAVMDLRARGVRVV